MSNKNYGVILGSNFLTVIADKAYSITTGDARYPQAVDFVKNKDWHNFFLLMDKPAMIARFSKGKIELFDNEVHYNRKPINGVIAERILQFMKDGFDFKPLVNFLDNLYENLDEDIRSKLYKFLENNQLAITENGSFLAFKLVRNDGTPIYHNSGTFLNEKGQNVRAYEVGQKFFFPKDQIRKTNGECSTQGLYVGNKNYWNGQFDEQNNYTGEGKMLIVEIYPQNVCNVPHADATKIVVCELKVLSEYVTIVKKANQLVYCDGEEVKYDDSSFWDEDILPNSTVEFGDELEDTKPIAKKQKRLPNGRFAPKVKLVKKSAKSKQKRSRIGRFI